MSFSDRAMTRATRMAERRRRALSVRIAERCNDVPGVRAEASGEGVELVGYGLLRRWLDDARLRFAGGGR